MQSPFCRLHVMHDVCAERSYGAPFISKLPHVDIDNFMAMHIERYIFIDIDIDVDIREISPFDTWPFDTNLLMRTPSKHGGKVSARGAAIVQPVLLVVHLHSKRRVPSSSPGQVKIQERWYSRHIRKKWSWQEVVK